MKKIIKSAHVSIIVLYVFLDSSMFPCCSSRQAYDKRILGRLEIQNNVNKIIYFYYQHDLNKGITNLMGIKTEVARTYILRALSYLFLEIIQCAYLCQNSSYSA